MEEGKIKAERIGRDAQKREQERIRREREAIAEMTGNSPSEEKEEEKTKE